MKSFPSELHQHLVRRLTDSWDLPDNIKLVLVKGVDAGGDGGEGFHVRIPQER